MPWGGKELAIGLGGFLGGSLAVVALLLGGTALAVKLGGVEVGDAGSSGVLTVAVAPI